MVDRADSLQGFAHLAQREWIPSFFLRMVVVCFRVVAICTPKSRELFVCSHRADGQTGWLYLEVVCAVIGLFYSMFWNGTSQGSKTGLCPSVG